MRVLLVDDNATIRYSVGRHLRSSLPESAVREVVDGAEALEACRREPWDVVVLDILMPGESGISVLARLKREFNAAPPVIMFSSHVDDILVRHCLREGAAGFVSKESADCYLAPAIIAVLAGEIYLCPVAEAVSNGGKGATHRVD